jgi:ParB family chromosome partitioning protein
VRRRGERFQIIAGERRWRAAQKAGLHKVPCLVKEVPDNNVLQLSLIENVQREELNPIEEANAYRMLLENEDLTQQDIAVRVGKDRSSIANMMRLLKLPMEVQQQVEEDKLSMGHARALLTLESPEQQVSIARQIAAKRLSVRETEQLVKRAQGGALSKTAKPRSTGGPDAEAANVLAAETKLSKKLGAPVKIKLTKNGGFVEIKFSSNDELSRLFDSLMQAQLFSARP